MAVQFLNGTWEEISLHAAELVGKTLRLTVLPEIPGDNGMTAAPMTSKEEIREALRKIMARQAGIRETIVYRPAPTDSTDRFDK